MGSLSMAGLECGAEPAPPHLNSRRTTDDERTTANDDRRTNECATDERVARRATGRRAACAPMNARAGPARAAAQADADDGHLVACFEGVAGGEAVVGAAGTTAGVC